ncbi:Lrp/AsnC ligand binding domain-containing protein [Promethearchaeum syntrophicum]|uniref:Lrp/AsnC ligand binding domain-containing protein n=1 Tax=Promethearchaeum syntrophicum TaxID=2594042 RepID=A0A5B9D9G5_9ARCH|nr:Lrp/AsnC family transcriptional regulator [Candidatus Prometheoarchaeum syntrophicum]QEE15497.1 DNA-binding transcriptional regulator AsnC [Candidatus Prometheoarchaeum syntrophicum]
MQIFGKISNKMRLLEALYLNSRVKMSRLSEDFHLSRQSISTMRKNLWEKNIIASPAIILNQRMLHMENYIMEIKTNPTEPEVLSKLKKIPEVTSVDGIIGTYALIVKFEVRSKQRFAEILSELDKQIAQSSFQSYRIIETIEIFKIGGFQFGSDDSVISINEKKWGILDLLKKNYNLKLWPERKDDEFFSAEEKKKMNKINLSRELDGLLKERIIKGFSISFHHLSGSKYIFEDFQMKFYMRIKPQNIGSYNELARKLVYEPNVIDLYRTGEDFGLFAVIRAKNLFEFQKFIYHLYTDFKIKDTFTTVVIDEHFPAIFPPTLNIAKTIYENMS